MRRFLAGVGFAMGLAWLFRWRRKPAAAQTPAADPAEELKRKLAESRTAEPEPEPARDEEPTAPLEARRRAVHDRARAAIDEMRGRDQAE
jgi:hypothetical protein